MKWRRIDPPVPDTPAYPLVNLPELPANALDPPAVGIESALNEERRIAFRAMKALGLNGETDTELWPYFIDAEREARDHIAWMGKIFGDGSCDPITAGLVAAAMLARKMSLASLARGDMKSYNSCDKTYQSHLRAATEMCKAAAQIRSGAAKPFWEADEPETTRAAIDVEPEPEPAATAGPAPEEDWHDEVLRRVPKHAIESNDGTITHPEPGADPAPPAPSLAELLGDEEI